MKKIIIALVCVTMSLSMMAQSNDNKDNRRPRMEQGGPGRDGGDAAILKEIGCDTVKINQVVALQKQQFAAMKDQKKEQRQERMEENKEQREAMQAQMAQYRKDVRKILGDETYIKYLEAKCEKLQMGQRMRGGMGQRGQRGGDPSKGRGDGNRQNKEKED